MVDFETQAQTGRENKFQETLESAVGARQYDNFQMRIFKLRFFLSDGKNVKKP